MPKKESPPVTATLASVLQKRKQKAAAYDVLPTKLEGISLRVEAGEKPQVLKRALGKLAIAATEYAERKAELSALADQQKQPEKEIKDLAQAHEGLRGIQSDRDNFKLNVFPKHTISWNAALLKESLGLAYDSVVREELDVSIAIPYGFPTKKGPLTSELLQEALIKGLVGLGLPKQQLAMIVDPQVVAGIDEAKLAELVADGRISLLEGTGEVTETWAITVDPLRKP